MSVIVMGMEMPSGCDDCKLRYRHQGAYVTDHCFYNMKIIDPWTFGRSRNGDKPDWCPLRPLPKRHGRLIEAERLRAEFPYPSEGMGGWRNPDEAVVHKTGIWAAIDCAETIVEAEGE